MKVYRVPEGGEDGPSYHRTLGEASKRAREVAQHLGSPTPVMECTLALSGKDAIVAALNGGEGLFSEQIVAYAASARKSKAA